MTKDEDDWLAGRDGVKIAVPACKGGRATINTCGAIRSVVVIPVASARASDKYFNSVVEAAPVASATAASAIPWTAATAAASDISAVVF